MESTAGSCPRCQTALVETPDGMHCEQCQGTFVRADRAVAHQFDALESQTSDGEALPCPACDGTLTPVALGELELERCCECQGIWLDAGESIEAPDSQTSLARYLLFSVSLPERAVRSTIGLAAGAARETAALLVPQSFQSSKTYEIVVANSLKFLAQDVGGAEAEPDEEATSDDYMARKAVGNFVDLAGLATLHLSPLWMLAIVSDVAYGTKSYVAELADELKEQGLIDETSTINHVDDVLEAIRNTTGSAASAFDTPPLSIDQLKQTLDETREALNSAEYTSVLPEAELDQYWREMKQIATQENVSLLGVSGAMTMNTLGKLKTVSHGTLLGVQVAGGLFHRHVISHYVDSLAAIHERGFYQTLSESSQPYVAAVWNNFSTDRDTWTEQVVSGRAIGGAWKSVKSWFSGPKDSPGD